MKVLSIKQPWAYLIAIGFKDVENRDWATTYRGRILIHASKSRTDMGVVSIVDFCRDRIPSEQWSKIDWNDFDFGAIIGEVNIFDCRYRKPSQRGGLSPWHEDSKYGFYLSNHVMYDKPIPYRGQLGLFEAQLDPDEVRLARGN